MAEAQRQVLKMLQEGKISAEEADTARSLDAAAEMVRAVKDELSKPGADPFLIEVNDEQDGNSVHIFIG